jgi:hypothetical protein
MSGFEAGVVLAITADDTARVLSLGRGSPVTKPGHAVSNPRIRAGTAAVPSSCGLPWARPVGLLETARLWRCNEAFQPM